MDDDDGGDDDDDDDEDAPEPQSYISWVKQVATTPCRYIIYILDTVHGYKNGLFLENEPPTLNLSLLHSLPLECFFLPRLALFLT